MTVAHALALMRASHAGKFDLGGQPYWTHPVRVMDRLGPDASDDAKMTALLHDIVEDTSTTLADLAAEGFSPAVTDAVALLTRPAGMTYAAYIDRLAASGNAMAISVKLADLADNLDPERPFNQTESRTKRYLAARSKLTK